MLGYFVLFSVIGFLAATFLRKEQSIFTAYAIFAVIWGLSNGLIWGLVTFGELTAGFFIFKLTQGK